MNRRHFMAALAAAGVEVAWAPSGLTATTVRGYQRLLVLVELKGGNDGLNTVIPYADPDYARLRPRLGITRDRVLQLDARTGLHPALQPLLPWWREGELAIAQGVGYPGPNLSHFRSIEIWDTASDADEALDDGWVGRAFARTPPPEDLAADGVVVGSAEAGPLEAAGPRVIRLADPARFLREARLATPAADGGNPALRHILEVEQSIVHAARGLDAAVRFSTDFPPGGFGAAIRTACQAIGSHGGIAAVKLSLGGFDTHANQAPRHENLLKELATGLVALRAALGELGRWDRTLLMTYGEFGRRAAENQSGGTDHGSASVQFVAGGRVRGGFHGAAPRLDRLDGSGNPVFTTDFRRLYATVLESWWGLDSAAILGRRWAPLELIRA
jgi:uncharacterized protein (DUF1501 family)